MSTKFHGLRTIVYMVTSLKKAKDWYTKVLGVKPYFDTPFYVGYNIGGYELGLHPAKKGEGPSSATYWGVDDVKKEYDALIAAGAEPYEKPNSVGEGIIVAAVKDPMGNVLGLIYNPHFKTE
jgi:catechol 2,3-dioxygenase-like lactoylglutathione lyase family enzyme